MFWGKIVEGKALVATWICVLRGYIKNKRDLLTERDLAVAFVSYNFFNFLINHRNFS